MILIDFFVLHYMLLATVLRKPVITEFLSVFQLTFSEYGNNVSQLKNKVDYRLIFDCRRIYFEHYLNDQHDAGLRRIFIRDVQNATTVFIYQTNEQNAPLIIQTNDEVVQPTGPYLYQESEILDLIDFEVVLPVGLVYNEAQLRNDIDTFRLPGKTYLIVVE